MECTKCPELSHCTDLVLGRINFLWWYCTSQPLALALLAATLACCFFGIGVTASDYLSPNLHYISKFLSLLDNLAGLTLVAMGNASPDILSNFKAMNMGHGNLALSELLGASFFITSVVVGSMAILHPFKIPQKLFIRDLLFFWVICLLILFILLVKHISIFISALLICCYIAYVSYVVISHSVSRAKQLETMRNNRIRSNFVVDADETDDLMFSNLPSIEELNLSNVNEFDQDYQTELIDEYNTFRRENNDTYDLPQSIAVKQLINELISKKTIPIQLGDDVFDSITMSEAPMALRTEGARDWFAETSYLSTLTGGQYNSLTTFEKVKFIITLPINVLIKLTVPVSDTEIDRVKLVCMILFVNVSLFPSSLLHLLLLNVPLSMMFFINKPIARAFLGFVSSILWILVFATEVINVIKAFSTVYSISDEILGFTVFAVGNSIGDFIANYTISKMGMPIMAFGACFGGPLLSLTSVGVSTVIVLAKNKQPVYDIGFSPSLVVLNLGIIVNLALILILSARNQWVINERVGWTLVGNWVFVSSLCAFIEVFKLA